MIVTPDMPKEPGTTVEESGALIDLATVIGLDDVGALVKSDGEHVTLIVNSFAWPNEKIHLDKKDAIHLAFALIRQAIDMNPDDFEKSISSL